MWDQRAQTNGNCKEPKKNRFLLCAKCARKANPKKIHILRMNETVEEEEEEERIQQQPLDTGTHTYSSVESSIRWGLLITAHTTDREKINIKKERNKTHREQTKKKCFETKRMRREKIARMPLSSNLESSWLWAPALTHSPPFSSCKSCSIARSHSLSHPLSRSILYLSVSDYSGCDYVTMAACKFKCLIFFSRDNRIYFYSIHFLWQRSNDTSIIFFFCFFCERCDMHAAFVSHLVWTTSHIWLTQFSHFTSRTHKIICIFAILA